MDLVVLVLWFHNNIRRVIWEKKSLPWALGREEAEGAHGNIWDQGSRCTGTVLTKSAFPVYKEHNGGEREKFGPGVGDIALLEKYLLVQA